MFRGFIAIAGLILLCTPLNAALITVPDNYPTIQQAIEASNSGDTVDLSGRPVRIEGESGHYHPSNASDGDLPSPELFEKITPGQNIDAVFGTSGSGVHGNEDTSAGRVFVLESPEVFQVMSLCLCRGLDFHGDLVVAEDEVDFDL